MRSWDERWQGENYTYNVHAIEQLKNLADTRGITTAQLALAWLLAQGEDVAPIPGTRSERPTPPCRSTGTSGRAHACRACGQRVRRIFGRTSRPRTVSAAPPTN